MNLKIGQPQIEHVGGKSRLCSHIEEQGSDFLLWMEVDAAHEKYLCTERSDAFLIILLPYAMQNNLDIVCEGDISEKLYYQLTNYLIGPLARNIENYHPVKISCSLNHDILPSEHAVGTGFSGGVDSFYTVYTHMNRETPHYNLTHLLFINIDGGLEDPGYKNVEGNLNPAAAKGKEFADKYNFEFVNVNFNIIQFIRTKFSQTKFAQAHSFYHMAVPLALQKLFGIYLYSSFSSFADFRFDKVFSGYYDFLNVYCFSNENISFYSAGAGASRLEKVIALTDFPPSYDYLNVCDNEYGKNCGKCKKCIGNMVSLYALGKLDLYRNVYDVDYFYNNLNKYLRIVKKEKAWEYTAFHYAEAYELLLSKGLITESMFSRLSRRKKKK